MTCLSAHEPSPDRRRHDDMTASGRRRTRRSTTGRHRRHALGVASNRARTTHPIASRRPAGSRLRPSPYAGDSYEVAAGAARYRGARCRGGAIGGFQWPTLRARLDRLINGVMLGRVSTMK